MFRLILAAALSVAGMVSQADAGNCASGACVAVNVVPHVAVQSAVVTPFAVVQPQVAVVPQAVHVQTLAVPTVAVQALAVHPQIAVANVGCGHAQAANVRVFSNGHGRRPLRVFGNRANQTRVRVNVR